ncbi:YdeI/OmpD-associated family protein [Kordia jejudonensis]|uniref:YdeI/OmpD-associated family protein n=1 Tax=Kordia jejudonensis TaxID=1348245 RepID=UPI0006299F41|nr:DUF1801 domain-containing protein [Kordia jejudonensis]
MKKYKSVAAYLQSFPEWEVTLRLLQRIVLENSDVTETFKWNIPVYTVNGKNVLGLAAFKTHVGLWFFQGALLKDKANVLINAQEGKTQAMRHWKFYKDDEIPIDLVKLYVDEAVQHQKEGNVVAMKKSAVLELPELFKNAFKANSTLKEAFAALSNYKQKAYVEYIETAKRQTTREKRLEKIIPMILAGNGLNDKYR